MYVQRLEGHTLKDENMEVYAKDYTAIKIASTLRFNPKLILKTSKKQIIPELLNLRGYIDNKSSRKPKVLRFSQIKGKIFIYSQRLFRT